MFNSNFNTVMKKLLFMFASLAVLASCASKGEGEPVVDPTLSVTPVSLTVAPEGDDVTFKVTTNKSWTVTSNQAWAVVSPASGDACENKVVTVTVGANETGAARTANLTVKAETLTKTIKVSQEPVVVPTPDPNPTPDPTPGGNTAQYQRSTDPVMYAAGLQDGKYYVMYCRAYDLNSDDPKCWSESQNKLTLKSVNAVTYSAAEVFQFKADASKTSQPFDNYGSYASGAFKSMSTGKYLDASFNLNAELASAVWFEVANNWMNQGGDEINVLDMYKYPYSAGVESFWYRDAFLWAGNANVEGFTHHNRKWVAYEATVINQ